MKITIREDKWCHIKQDPALCEASWECWSHIQSWLTESVFSCSLLWSISLLPFVQLKALLPLENTNPNTSYLDKAKFLTTMHHSSAVWGTQALPQCVELESVPEIFLISSKVIVIISWRDNRVPCGLVQLSALSTNWLFIVMLLSVASNCDIHFSAECINHAFHIPG